MGMHSETHHMFVQILICVSAAHNRSLMQYTSTSIGLCLWEQKLEQKILAYFNSMMVNRSQLLKFTQRAQQILLARRTSLSTSPRRQRKNSRQKNSGIKRIELNKKTDGLAYTMADLKFDS